MPTEAAIVTIVAAYCGPMAVAEGAGMVSETGEIAKPENISGGSSGYGFFGTLIRLLLGISISILALVWADFGPLAFLGAMKEKLRMPSQVLAGVAILYSLVWIGFSGINGCFAMLALDVTAVYVGASALGVTKGMNPKVGIILGAVCAGLTALTVMVQGHLLVI